MFPVKQTGNWHGAGGDFDFSNNLTATKGPLGSTIDKLRVDYDQSTGNVQFTQDGVLIH